MGKSHKEQVMAENSGGGGNTLLALVVGALLVVVIGVFALGWWPGAQNTQVTLDTPEISTPDVDVNVPTPANPAN
jgi:hypothetical protein